MNNSKSLWTVVLVVVIVALAWYGLAHRSSSSTANSTNSPTSAAQSSNLVSIKDMAFAPASITVTVGTTVTWTNNDAIAHTVVGSDFTSGTLNQGATFSHTFATAGTFTYHCGIHPSMTGTVTVQ